MQQYASNGMAEGSSRLTVIVGKYLARVSCVFGFKVFFSPG